MVNRLLQYFLVSLITLAVMAAAGEATLRVISGGMYVERTTIELNPLYEYQNIPNIDSPHPLEDGTLNVLHTNSVGFAGREYAYEKPQNTTRIMVIGDSFIEGKSIQAEKLLTTFLEDDLNAGGKIIEVIPRGTSSWATENEVLYLKNEGIRYNPDVVVIAFFANDVMDNFDKKLYTLGPDGKLQDNTPFKFTLWQTSQIWCRSVSELCGFVRFKIYPLIFGEGRTNNFYWGIARDLVVGNTTQETSMNIDETKQILEEFLRLSKEKGFKPILLIIPFKEQVDSESMEKSLAQNGISPDDVDIMKTNRIIADIGNKIGLDVLDPTQFLIEKNKDGKVYYAADAHLNARGNEVLAEYLATRLP